MKFSKKEKEEFLRISKSKKLREDFENLKEKKHNPFIKDGKVDIERYIEFLNEYNKFINHAPKPFKKIIDKDMRL